MLSAVVLISGAGSNLRSLLLASENPLYPVTVLAVGADRPAAGLGYADEFGIPSFVVEPSRFKSQQEWSRTLFESIKFWKPDIILLAGFMRILPADFVRALSPRVINLHPSLLPSFPGAHAVRDALAAGVSVTGATIHVVDEGIDTGPVIAQREVPILANDDETSLHERIKQVERALLVETLQRIARDEIRLVDSARAND